MIEITLPRVITGHQNCVSTHHLHHYHYHRQHHHYHQAPCFLPAGGATTCLISILVRLLRAVLCLLSYVLCVPPTPFCLERAVVVLLSGCCLHAACCFLPLAVLSRFHGSSSPPMVPSSSFVPFPLYASHIFSTLLVLYYSPIFP